MASDSELTRRKHHRSASPDDTDEHSKRRKHRHHRHHHRHHRHRSGKVREEVRTDEMEVVGIHKIEVEEGKYGNNGDESGAVIDVMVNNRLEFSGVDYDMEEGEIVEEHGLVDNGSGDLEKSNKNLDSDMESGEVKNDLHNNSNLEANKHDMLSINKNLKKSGQDKVDGQESGEWDRVSASSSEVLAKGGYAHKYHEDVHRLLGEDGKRTIKSGDEIEPCSRRKTLSSEKRHGAISCSHSHEKYLKESSHILKSPEQTGEKLPSQSIFSDASVVVERYYMGIKKQRRDPDDERMISPSRYCRNSSKDDTQDKEKELNSRRYSDRTERHHSRETHYRYRQGSQERDWDKDRDRTREKEMEKEKERVRIRDRDRLERDREREITKDRTRERERERERERDQVREGRNKGTDRGREGVRDGGRARSRDKDRDHESDRLSNRQKNDNNEAGYRDRDNDSRHRRNTEDHHRDRSRRSDLENTNLKRNPHKRDGENLKRGDDGQEDYQDKIVMQLAIKEEDDLERIKEESRRRKQAILEKYKKQSSERNELQSEAMVMKQVGQSYELVASADTAVENIDSRVEGVENFVSESSFSVGKLPLQNGHLSAFERPAGAGGLGEITPKSERSEDMFCDDIFGESPAVVRKTGKGDSVAVERSGLHDNWDDAEGYYGYRFGEILDGQYEIIAAHGKGVFSTVVRAKDLKAKSVDHEEVAIKIIRNNETMYKAGMEELVVLKKLVRADPENKRHCVRFLSSFKYRNHLCLVFESLHMNLREVLKKFGRNIGLKLTAVRSYAKQLFMALKHLKNSSVLHCDIKPDNMLVNEAKNVLKLCDFGNAMFAGKNEITPYLVSRFYRAPEIILGLPYDHPVDIWSVGCCLFELYTGKVLFPGPTNNDMLRLHMELKGPFPKKMLRKGAFTNQHFDQDLNFHATEEDPVTKKAIRRLLVNVKPKDFGSLLLGSPGEEPKMLANFRDLMEKIFVLDPDKRLNVSQALSHPFITGK